MKLEEQVCSLKLAKKLKKLGVKQEGSLCWVKYKDRYEIWDSGTESWYKDKQWSAFTASELGEMLPQFVRVKHGRIKEKRNFRLEIRKDAYGRFFAGYVKQEEDEPDFVLCAGLNTMANALAKNLIYLLENKLIKK